jgi:N6-L-threonylcarbamoyladenine synthase
LEKPLIAVNHLEGHIHAVLLEQKQRGEYALQFPVLALVVSGGHTHLFLAEQHGDLWSYRNVGRTRDDAAGEAYDKVAKLLGLGYPGGPIIDKLAARGNPHAVHFTFAQIKGPARHEDRYSGQTQGPTFDFSFSGIKTAVLRYVETHDMQAGIEARRRALAGKERPSVDDFLAVTDQATLDLVASFQRAVVDDLVGKTLAAAREYDAQTIFVTGGVAANSELRTRFEGRGAKEGFPVSFPSRPLSTDNAAMIAAAAYPKFLAREFAGPEFSAEAALTLK